MTMSNWIPVSPTDVDAQKKTLEGGVQFELHVSPYDMPQAVRGHFDPATKHFVITFKYITLEEKTNVVQAGNGINLHIGVKSNRLQSIEVDVEAFKALTSGGAVQRIADQVKDGINSALPQGEALRLNAFATKKLLESKRSQIFSDLVSCYNN